MLLKALEIAPRGGGGLSGQSSEMFGVDVGSLTVGDVVLGQPRVDLDGQRVNGGLNLGLELLLLLSKEGDTSQWVHRFAPWSRSAAACWSTVAVAWA